jgi:hypothetical protein
MIVWRLSGQPDQAVVEEAGGLGVARVIAEGLAIDEELAYSVMTPNRVHVAAGQYLYCTSPSTSPRAMKPIVRLSRELFRLSPSTKHVPSGTFALG